MLCCILLFFPLFQILVKQIADNWIDLNRCSNWTHMPKVFKVSLVEVIHTPKRFHGSRFNDSFSHSQ